MEWGDFIGRGMVWAGEWIRQDSSVSDDDDDGDGDGVVGGLDFRGSWLSWLVKRVMEGSIVETYVYTGGVLKGGYVDGEKNF